LKIRKGDSMTTQISNALYIMGASCELMEKVRKETDNWAESNTNICMTYEQAVEIEELRPYLKETFGCDVILSK
jgi:hypothetical protein